MATGAADYQAAMPAEYRMDISIFSRGVIRRWWIERARRRSRGAAWLANPRTWIMRGSGLRRGARIVALRGASGGKFGGAAGAAPAAAPPAKDGPPVVPNAPLLFVQLDDDVANGRTNYAGPAVWRYLESLREALRSGGVRCSGFHQCYRRASLGGWSGA